MKRSRRARNPRRRSSGLPLGKIAAFGVVGGIAYALYQAGGSISTTLSNLNPFSYLSSAASSAEDEASSLLSSAEAGVSGGLSSLEGGLSSVADSAESEAGSLWSSVTSALGFGSN